MANPALFPRRDTDWELVDFTDDGGQLEILRIGGSDAFEDDDEAALFVWFTAMRHPNAEVQEECRAAVREIVGSWGELTVEEPR